MALVAFASDLFYAAPLVVAISLVYAGTRFESPNLIARHALRVGAWMTVFMTCGYFFLQLLQTRL